MTSAPPKVQLASGLEISRVVIGLWQVADMEKDGRRLDLVALAGEMSAYAQAGFDTFDMADHYGSAEDIAGQFNAASGGQRAPGAAPKLLTKWCPEPGPVPPEMARAASRPRSAAVADHPDRSDAIPLVDVSAPGMDRCTKGTRRPAA